MHFEEWTREQQDKARVGNPFHTAILNVLQRSNLSVQHQKHPEGLSVPRFLRLALSFWLSISEMGSENLHFWQFPGDAAGLLPGDAPRDHTLRIIALGNEKLLKGFTEVAMAPHSSTLAWKIPWMEEPGRLQSMGSQRVGYDWATSLSLFTFMHWRRKWKPTPVFLPGESQGQQSPMGCRLWGCTE